MTAAGARLRHFSERLDAALVKAAADRGMRFVDKADVMRRLRARVTVGDLTLIPPRYVTRGAGPAVTLGPVEFGVLRLLMERPDEFVERKWLRAQVWGRSPKSPAVLPSTVGILQEKIGTGDPMIDLIHGAGYVLRGSLDVDEASAIKFADVVLNPLAHSAKRGDRDLNLTHTGFVILERFMDAPGKYFTVDDLADAAVRPGREPPAAQSIKNSIVSLRRDLESGGEPRLIHNKYGVGYVLEER